MESIRLLSSVAAHETWEVHHMNVKTTFLNGDLRRRSLLFSHHVLCETVKNTSYTNCIRPYMAPRASHQTWFQSSSKHATHGRSKGTSWLLVGVFVDDLVITGNTQTEILKFKGEMHSLFKMSDLGLLGLFSRSWSLPEIRWYQY